MFALAKLRGVHLGILMFVAACALGVTLAGMTLREVMAGFPVGILILVAGVTYFFGIAQLNGTIDRVMGAMLARTGGRPVVVPLVFFVLAAVMAAMGSPQAGLATGPVGHVHRQAGRRRSRADGDRHQQRHLRRLVRADQPVRHHHATGLRGEAGIDVTPVRPAGGWRRRESGAARRGAGVLFAGARSQRRRRASAARRRCRCRDAPVRADGRASTTWHQRTRWPRLRLALVPGIIAGTLAGLRARHRRGRCSASGALLALLDPALGARAFARIDWSTAFVVGGIVTYVGVLQKLGRGEPARARGDGHRHAARGGAGHLHDRGAGVGVCVHHRRAGGAGADGGAAGARRAAVPGWALITTLGVSATIVDGSPFSNTGATLIASAPRRIGPAFA